MTNLETSYQSPLQVSPEEKPKPNSFFTKTAAFLAFSYLLNLQPSMPDKKHCLAKDNITMISTSYNPYPAEAREEQTEKNAQEIYSAMIGKKIDSFSDVQERPPEVNNLIISIMDYQAAELTNRETPDKVDKINQDREAIYKIFTQYLPEKKDKPYTEQNLWEMMSYDLPQYLGQYGIYTTPMVINQTEASEFTGSSIIMNFYQIESINSLKKNDPDYQKIKSAELPIKLWDNTVVNTNVIFVKPLAIDGQPMTIECETGSFYGIANYQNVAINYMAIHNSIFNSGTFFDENVYQELKAAGYNQILQDLKNCNGDQRRVQELAFYNLVLKKDNQLPKLSELIWQNICHETGHVNSMQDPNQKCLFDTPTDLTIEENEKVCIHQELEGKLAEYSGVNDLTVPIIELTEYSAEPIEKASQDHAIGIIANKIIDECIDAKGEPKHGFKRLFAEGETNICLRDQIRFQFAIFLDNPKLFKQLINQIHDQHLGPDGLTDKFLRSNPASLATTAKPNRYPYVLGGLGLTGAGTIAAFLAWRRKRKMQEKQERIDGLRKSIKGNGKRGKKRRK